MQTSGAVKYGQETSQQQEELTVWELGVLEKSQWGAVRWQCTFRRAWGDAVLGEPLSEERPNEGRVQRCQQCWGRDESSCLSRRLWGVGQAVGWETVWKGRHGAGGLPSASATRSLSKLPVVNEISLGIWNSQAGSFGLGWPLGRHSVGTVCLFVMLKAGYCGFLI